jgi:hypothetical protein
MISTHALSSWKALESSNPAQARSVASNASARRGRRKNEAPVTMIDFVTAKKHMRLDENAANAHHLYIGGGEMCMADSCVC